MYQPVHSKNIIKFPSVSSFSHRLRYSNHCSNGFKRLKHPVRWYFFCVFWSLCSRSITDGLIIAVCVVGRRKDVVKVKVKCTLVQALRLCTGRTAHRGSRGIALPFLDHDTRRVDGSASRPGRSLPPLYMRVGGPQGRSGQLRKISPPTGIRSPDRPARSQSLYRLR